MKHNQRKVCVIIVSYNFERWIDRCLLSLFCSAIAVDVVVIDNCSKDNTVKRIRKNYRQIKLIENRENLGFGKANNIGLSHAVENDYNYAFLLNQDAWIEKDMLEKLIESAEANPDFGIISPVHLSPDGTSLDHGFANYSQKETIEQLPQQSSQLVELPFVNAAFWLLPIATVKKIGGFSPLFYHYGEDRNYILRIHFHNLKIGYHPNAFATHDRHNRKVSNKQLLHADYIYFLSELANINYSLQKAIAYSVFAAIKKMFIEAWHGRLSNSKAYLTMSLKLFTKILSANATRNETKISYKHSYLIDTTNRYTQN